MLWLTLIGLQEMNPSLRDCKLWRLSSRAAERQGQTEPQAEHAVCTAAAKLQRE